MAEILINEKDVETMIKSYTSVDDTFVFKNCSRQNNKWSFNFYIDSKECKVDVYFKKGQCKVLPIGKNIVESNKLISYLIARCPDASKNSIQQVFDCDMSISNKLITYLEEEKLATIDQKPSKGKYELKGYGGDVLHLNIFEKKIIIQGRPLCLYGIVISYLSKYILIEEMVNVNFNGNMSLDVHRQLLKQQIKQKIKGVYDYLDQPLIESLSSSFDIIQIFNNNTLILEDYTGLLVGAFKALEGYLKKVLNKKFKYKQDEFKKFEMFYKKKGVSHIDKNTNIGNNQKKQLNILYSLYKDKRNVYLHASAIASATVVIKKYDEAKNIMNDIIKAISDSYDYLV